MIYTIINLRGWGGIDESICNISNWI
jgi:hypothetical protein